MMRTPAMCIIVVAIVATTAFAQIPHLISYQGVLSDSLGSPKPDGSYSLTFRLYDSELGGSAFWTETKTLTVKRGLFSTSLGDQVPFGASVRFDKPYWLSIQVAANPELSPRVPLTAVGYSFNSLKADTAAFAQAAPVQQFVDSARIAGTVADNAVSSTKIANGTLKVEDLEAGFVAPKADTATYALSAPAQSFVDSARVAGSVRTNSVTSVEIADGTIQRADVASSFVAPYSDTAGYARSAPAVGSVDSARIAGTVPDNVITTTKLADASVTTTKMSGLGASSGQSLMWNGSSVVWGNPTGGGSVWNQVGSNISYNAGWVGLGTDTPKAKLDVDFGSVGALRAGTPMGGGPGWIFISPNNHRRDLRVGNSGLSIGVGTDLSSPDAHIFVNESGQIGIGTTDMSSKTKLHVNAATDNFGLLVSSEMTPGSEIGLHTGNGKWASLVKNAYFDYSNGWNRFDESAGAFLQEVQPNGNVTSFLAGPGANPISWADATTLTTDGRVGIGIGTPASKLHIRGTTPTYVTVEAPDGYAPGYTLRIGPTDQWTTYCYPTDKRLGFFREGVGEMMALTTTGRLGIGLSNPEQLLHVYGNSNPRVLVDAPDGSTPEYNLRRGWNSYNIYLNSEYSLCFYKDYTHIVFTQTGSIGVGTTSPEEKLHVVGNVKCSALKLTGGGDIAEPFDITEVSSIKPGMVVSIDPAQPGKLRVAREAYDRRVAGIVSGAGGIEPGVVMSKKGSAADGTIPIAMTGRVYCLADASNGSIEPGDLLTTSTTPGHAMKVTDYPKAQGAIIGKAMSELREGSGLVLVLVSLQ